MTPSAGDYIPGDGEEKIFIALMQIMKERGMPKKFVVSLNDLRIKLKIETNDYAKRIKKSLTRLAMTNYAFKNTLYSSDKKGVFGEEIITTMFSMRTITLSLPENKRYKAEINDDRVKEIYEISISDHFYKNSATRFVMKSYDMLKVA